MRQSGGRRRGLTMEIALIADPDPKNRLILLKLLKVAGVRALEAESGAAATSLFGNQTFTFAIINNTLTDIPAVVVAQRIRRRIEAENFAPDARIIAIIANDAKKKAFPPYLINAFLIPPITSDDFTRALGVPSLRGYVEKRAQARAFSEKMKSNQQKMYAQMRIST